MEDVLHLGGVETDAVRQVDQALDHSLRGIIGRRHLVDIAPLGARVSDDDVGEGSTDVDSGEDHERTCVNEPLNTGQSTYSLGSGALKALNLLVLMP